MNGQLYFERVTFENFKSLDRYGIDLKDINILVGPNNCGKSTVIGAFRALAVGLRRAYQRSPEFLDAGQLGRRFAYRLSRDDLPISVENSHTNYSERDASVTFQLSNRRNLQLRFVRDADPILLEISDSSVPRTPSAFRAHFPIQLGIVPMLSGVEHDEQLVLRETVTNALATHRASRHFRNYWYHNPERFDEFASMVSSTWPQMELRKPDLDSGSMKPTLTMFCRERGIEREIYWIGSGFQIWCQILSHAFRNSGGSLLVIDEPEIYLHPDMQRQLGRVLRRLDIPLLVATHSSELVSESEPHDILVMDRVSRAAKRLKESVQPALEVVGSNQNVILSQLARHRRLLFVEGQDFKLLSAFADVLKLDCIASSNGVSVVPVGGFSEWTKARDAAWGFREALHQPMKCFAVFDRDYYPEEKLAEVRTSLRAAQVEVEILDRKEIENYLLVDRAIQKALAIAVKRRGQEEGPTQQDVTAKIDEIMEAMRPTCLGQMQEKQWNSLRVRGDVDQATVNAKVYRWFEERWADRQQRLGLVGGKEVFAAVGKWANERFKVSLSPRSVIREMRPDDIALGLRSVLERLNAFAISDPPAAGAD